MPAPRRYRTEVPSECQCSRRSARGRAGSSLGSVCFSTGSEFTGQRRLAQLEIDRIEKPQIGRDRRSASGITMSPHAEPSAPAGARSRGTYFRRPGTLFLPISIRIPVLADRTAGAESLLGAVAETARPGLAECFRWLMAAGSVSTHVRKPIAAKEYHEPEVAFIVA